MARLKLNPAAVRKAAAEEGEKLVRAMSKATTIQASKNAPGGPYSTGRLKQSMKWSITSVGVDGVRGEVGSDLVYANSVHGGQPNRLITPKRARALRFFWRRTGQWETFASVNHPGTQAQPYLTRAMRQTAPRFGFKTITF